MTTRKVKVLEQGKLVVRGVQADHTGVYLSHDDDETQKITFDWSRWLGSDTIASKAVEVDGPTVVVSSPSNTTTLLTISGDPGHIQHRVVTTTSAETKEIDIWVAADKWTGRDYELPWPAR